MISFPGNVGRRQLCQAVRPALLPGPVQPEVGWGSSRMIFVPVWAMRLAPSPHSLVSSVSVLLFRSSLLDMCKA